LIMLSLHCLELGALALGKLWSFLVLYKPMGSFGILSLSYTIDLKAFELHCNMQTSGLGTFITNNWEFWVGILVTSSQIVRILAMISLVIIMWWMSFSFSCSLYVFLYQSCLQHVLFYFNIVWKRTYLITIPFLRVEYSHIKFCHLF
jgi:hypothetical protein